MGNLIKPAEYAKKLGISRQAVYAKIKKGVLTSKSVEGKLYIVQSEANLESTRADMVDNLSAQSVNSRTKPSASTKGFQDLLLAKDETIGILKETITDLKETNKMITSTLRGEVDLLKEAFSEMKMLYSTQIEHLQIEEHAPVDADDARDELDMAVDLLSEDDVVLYDGTEDGDELAWIELEGFFDEHGIRKKAKQKKIAKKFKKLLKKGDSRIDSFDGELIVLADADYSDLLKKRKKA
jgi:predicted DNA-binding protein YlxM (UPF0122 family)